MRLGIPELLVILGIVVLLWGGKKIPEIGRGLGEGIRNFKEGLRSGNQQGPGSGGQGSAS